jgi:hypothetical protein
MESNGLFGWVENREERKETRENEMFSIVWLRIRQMGGAFFIRAHKNSLSKLERKSGFRVKSKDFLSFILLHDFSFLVKAYKLYFSSFHFSILPTKHIHENSNLFYSPNIFYLSTFFHHLNQVIIN